MERITTRNLYSLLKPGLAFSVVITAVPALLLGPSIPPWFVWVGALLGTFLTAMSSFCYNQILEIKTDSLMERTKDRVLPAGVLSSGNVHAIGSTLLLVGLIILYLSSGLLASLLALNSFLFYLFVYTLLKPRTVHNTVIGSVCGAIGPLIGEAAATGTVTQYGVLLFLMMFLWQPPHFWALAIFRKDDYAKADFPMLPVAQGIPATVKQMVFYESLLVMMIALTFFVFHLGGWLFFAPSFLLGIYILFRMIQLGRSEDPLAARRIFFLTILHVNLWHALLTIDILLERAGYKFYI